MSAWVYLAIAVVLVGFAVGSFFVGRHGESDRPQPGWQRTHEVFRDPGSERTMRVWLDDAGGRHYVAEGRADSRSAGSVTGARHAKRSQT